jgi:hypothetical protein
MRRTFIKTLSTFVKFPKLSKPQKFTGRLLLKPFETNILTNYINKKTNLFKTLGFGSTAIFGAVYCFANVKKQNKTFPTKEELNGLPTDKLLDDIDNIPRFEFNKFIIDVDIFLWTKEYAILQGDDAKSTIGCLLFGDAVVLVGRDTQHQIAFMINFNHITDVQQTLSMVRKQIDAIKTQNNKNIELVLMGGFKTMAEDLVNEIYVCTKNYDDMHFIGKQVIDVRMEQTVSVNAKTGEINGIILGLAGLKDEDRYVECIKTLFETLDKKGIKKEDIKSSRDLVQYFGQSVATQIK